VLTIKDPTLKRMILEHMIERLDQEGYVALIAEGADPELLEVLKHRAALDIVRAANTKALPDMAVDLEAPAVIGCFTRLDAIKRDVELQDYLVANGATNEMLLQWFRLDKHEATRLRALMLPEGKPRGMPPPNERPAVHVTWSQICRTYSDENTPSKVRRLHEAHRRWPIHALWSTLHEFGDDASIPASASKSRSR